MANGNGNGYSRAVQTIAVALTLLAMIGGGIWQLGMRPPREEVKRDITAAESRLHMELDETEARMEANLDRKLELILYRLNEIQEDMK